MSRAALLMLVLGAVGSYSPVLRADELDFCRLHLHVLTGRVPVPGLAVPTLIKDRSVTTQPNEHDVALNHLADTVRELGYVPVVHEWTEPRVKRPGTVTLKNLEVTVPGTDPDLKAETVLFGAHYDVQNSRGLWHGTRGQGYLVSPGADDNGSGVVALLALMKRLKNHPPKRTIKFVFFDGEEPGRLISGMNGSRRYVESLGPDVSKVHMAVIFDMIGAKPRGENGAYHLSAFRFSPQGMSQFLASHPTAGNIPFFIQGPQDSQFHGMYTDSGPFIRRGVPTLMFSNTATLKDLPVNYHSEKDGPDVIDWETFPKLIDHFERIARKAAY